MKYISQFPNKGSKWKKAHVEWGYRGLKWNLSQAPEQRSYIFADIYLTCSINFKQVYGTKKYVLSHNINSINQLLNQFVWRFMPNTFNITRFAPHPCLFLVWSEDNKTPHYLALIKMKTRKMILRVTTLSCLFEFRKTFFRDNIGKVIWKRITPNCQRLLSSTFARIHLQLTYRSVTSRKNVSRKDS